MPRFFRKKKLTPFQTIILGFAAVVLVGALILMLPISSSEGKFTPFHEALFTSTSSVCVTGLVVHDTGSYWSSFGQSVILLLIQVGGLGDDEAGDLTLLGMHLTEVPAGTYILGHQGQTGAFNEAAPAPYAKQITKVYISEQITKDAFSKFVKVYPKWAEKIEYSLESTDKEHVSNVSWYGAQAYCQYLTDQLPADFKDKYIFRLPNEYEWEAYAQNGKDRPQSLWDWCQNWYAPAEVFYSNNVPDTFPGAEKAVRGGGRQAWVRGCQSPDWVTPYIGFRVVLVEK